jgi:hypothetical protein
MDVPNGAASVYLQPRSNAYANPYHINPVTVRMDMIAHNYIEPVAFFCPVLLWFTFHLLRDLAIMEPTTPPSTPVSESVCPTYQEITFTKVRALILLKNDSSHYMAS